MKYRVERTDTADSMIHRIILHIAEVFGKEVAVKSLSDLENAIKNLEENPFCGIVPKYDVLKRRGYLVLVLKKDLVFYKVDEINKVVMIYAVVDQRQEYLSIVMGL